MFFHSKDLPDLQWDALGDLADMDDRSRRMAEEVVRDRTNDRQEQPDPSPAQSRLDGEDNAVASQPTQQSAQSESANKAGETVSAAGHTRPARKRNPPDHLKDYVTVLSMLDDLDLSV